MATSFINGTQIDFQVAIIFDSNTGIQSSYEHLYFVRNVVAGNDRNESTNMTANDPCLKIQCGNGGSCLIGFNNLPLCLCPSEYSGRMRINLLNTHFCEL